MHASESWNFIGFDHTPTPSISRLSNSETAKVTVNSTSRTPTVPHHTCSLTLPRASIIDRSFVIAGILDGSG
jgi:hypothetical protein